MSRSMKIGAVVAVLVSGCATTSGPEVPNHVTFRARQIPEVQNILIGRCASGGGTVISQTNNVVVCEKEMNGGAALMTQFAIGDAGSTHPVADLTYTLTSNGMDTTVFWSLQGKTQGAFGQVRQMPIEGSKVNAQMAAALRTAGAE
jgi:hypothetical protein